MIKKILILIPIFLLSITGISQQPKYIGASKCKMCHNSPSKGEQYNKWVNGPHSKAWTVLSEEEQQDTSCLACHSTAATVDKKLWNGITIEEGVSCESCHGPGSIFKAPGLMRDTAKAKEKGLLIPDENTCLKCHNERSPNFKGFDYQTYLDSIIHWPKPEIEE